MKQIKYEGLQRVASEEFKKDVSEAIQSVVPGKGFVKQIDFHLGKFNGYFELFIAVFELVKTVTKLVLMSLVGVIKGVAHALEALPGVEKIIGIAMASVDFALEAIKVIIDPRVSWKEKLKNLAIVPVLLVPAAVFLGLIIANIIALIWVPVIFAAGSVLKSVFDIGRSAWHLFRLNKEHKQESRYCDLMMKIYEKNSLSKYNYKVDDISVKRAQKIESLTQEISKLEKKFTSKALLARYKMSELSLADSIVKVKAELKIAKRKLEIAPTDIEKDKINNQIAKLTNEQAILKERESIVRMKIVDLEAIVSQSEAIRKKSSVLNWFDPRYLISTVSDRLFPSDETRYDKLKELYQNKQILENTYKRNLTFLEGNDPNVSKPEAKQVLAKTHAKLVTIEQKIIECRRTEPYLVKEYNKENRKMRGNVLAFFTACFGLGVSIVGAIAMYTGVAAPVGVIAFMTGGLVSAVTSKAIYSCVDEKKNREQGHKEETHIYQQVTRTMLADKHVDLAIDLTTLPKKKKENSTFGALLKVFSDGDIKPVGKKEVEPLEKAERNLVDSKVKIPEPVDNEVLENPVMVDDKRMSI